MPHADSRHGAIQLRRKGPFLMKHHDLPENWNSCDGHVAEYNAAALHLGLELPDGESLPPLPEVEPDPGIYEAGSGDVRVLFAWLHIVECAAVRAHHSGDDVESQRWTEVAAKFMETDTFAKHNDHTAPITWFDSVIVPARAGNFGPMAQETGLEDAAGRN